MGDQEGAQLIASGNRLSAFFDVDETSIITSIKNEFPQPSPTNENHSIQLIPVHTFILHSPTKDVRLSRGILVPSFASHWGVVVGQPGEYMLYHLIFRPNQEPRKRGTGDSIRGNYREVKFHYIEWNDKEDEGNMIKVGETRYSYLELIRIGTKMIDMFGDYHRVFWNCQTFAKCFLQVICGPDASAKFNAWTLSDASCMFLCAFIVGIPLVTTQKVNEARKIKELFLAVQSETSSTTKEMESLSDRAIDFILYQASLEPENRQILSIPAKSKKSFFEWLGSVSPWKRE